MTIKPGKNTGGSHFYKAQPEALVVAATGEAAAAGETGDAAAKRADTGKICAAISAAIKIRPGELPRWDRQTVTGGFVGEIELATGAAPFASVRPDAPAAGAILRQEMGQLVTQRVVDFLEAEVL